MLAAVHSDSYSGQSLRSAGGKCAEQNSTLPALSLPSHLEMHLPSKFATCCAAHRDRLSILGTQKRVMKKNTKKTCLAKNVQNLRTRKKCSPDNMQIIDHDEKFWIQFSNNNNSKKAGKLIMREFKKARLPETQHQCFSYQVCIESEFLRCLGKGL